MAVPPLTHSITPSTSSIPSTTTTAHALQEYTQKDFVGLSQTYLIITNDLYLTEEDVFSDNLQQHIAGLLREMKKHLSSRILLLSPQERQKLTDFPIWSFLRDHSLTELFNCKSWIINDEQNESFDRYVQAINLGINGFFGRIPGLSKGSESHLVSIKKTITDRLSKFTQAFNAQTKNDELTSENAELAQQVRALKRLLSFCDAAEKLCIHAGQEEGPEWETKWEAFWTSDLGKYLEASYLIEIFKREYKNFQEDQTKPLNQWMHNVSLQWLEELLMTAPFPELVEEMYAAIAYESKSSPTAEKHQDALKIFQIKAAQCLKNYYPQQWETYIRNFASPNREIERDICLKLLQDRKHKTTITFESSLKQATTALIASPLTYAEACSLYTLHSQVSQVMAPLQPLVLEALEGIYFSRLWEKYLDLLTQFYPKRPGGLEFTNIEKELLIGIKNPAILQFITTFTSALNNTYFSKNADLTKLSNIWRKKPVVPSDLQELVNDSYDKVWGFRIYSATKTTSPHSPFVQINGITAFGAAAVKRLTSSAPESVESIRAKLSLMTTPGLVTWYLGQLEKPPSDLHLQAGLETLNSRKLSSKDIDTSKLSIPALKSLHDKIAQKNLTHKALLLESLYQAIEGKLDKASYNELSTFLTSVEAAAPNGWSPLVHRAQNRVFVSKCQLYYEQLKTNGPLVESAEKALEKHLQNLTPPEDALDFILAPELQGLYLKILHRTTSSEKTKTFFLKTLEPRLQKKIETLDLTQTKELIGVLKTAQIQGAVLTSAQKRFDQLLQKMSTAELLKAYLLYRIDPQPDTELLTLFERHLQAKTDLDAVIAQSLDSKSFKKILFEQLVALLGALEKQLPLLKTFVEELIVAKIWVLNQQDLNKQAASSSSFVRKIADVRSRSLAPTPEENDALVLALLGSHEQLQKLETKALEEAKSNLQHLTLFGSSTSNCIQDRRKALHILEKALKNPRLEPQVQTATKTENVSARKMRKGPPVSETQSNQAQRNLLAKNPSPLPAPAKESSDSAPPQAPQRIEELWKSFIRQYNSPKKSNTATLERTIKALQDDFSNCMRNIVHDVDFVNSWSLDKLKELQQSINHAPEAFWLQYKALIHQLTQVNAWKSYVRLATTSHNTPEVQKQIRSQLSTETSRISDITIESIVADESFVDSLDLKVLLDLEQKWEIRSLFDENCQTIFRTLITKKRLDAWKIYVRLDTTTPTNSRVKQEICSQLAKDTNPISDIMIEGILAHGSFVDSLDLQALIDLEKQWNAGSLFEDNYQALLRALITKKHLYAHLQALTQNPLFRSELSPDFLIQTLAGLLKYVSEGEQPTALSLEKARQIVSLQFQDFTFEEIVHIGKGWSKTQAAVYIEELFWHKIEALSLKELQGLESQPLYPEVKQVLTHYREVRQLMTAIPSKAPSHYYPYALALALLPEDARQRRDLIEYLIALQPKNKAAKESLEKQISFLKSFPQKTSFLEQRLAAYQLALHPPALPPQASQPSPSKPKNRIAEHLPLYFLEQLKSAPQTAPYEASTTNLKASSFQLAQYCLPQMKDCSFTDFDKLLLANEKSPLLVDCLFELLWQKLALMKPEDLISHVKQYEDVAIPMEQVYAAYHYAGLFQGPASNEDIQNEQDPFTLALAIHMQQGKHRKILDTSLTDLLKTQKAKLPTYEALLKNLPSQSLPLLDQRRKAYELLCKTIKSLQ